MHRLFFLLAVLPALLPAYLRAVDPEICRQYLAALSAFEGLKLRVEMVSSVEEGRQVMIDIGASTVAVEPKEKADLAIELLRRLSGATAAQKAALWETFAAEAHRFFQARGSQFASNSFPSTPGSFVFAGREIVGDNGGPGFVPILILDQDGSVTHARITPERLTARTPVNPSEFRQ